MTEENFEISAECRKVRIIGEYNNGNFLGQAYIGGNLYFIDFPGIAIKNLKLDIEDEFIWYIDPNSYILPEHCFKESEETEESIHEFFTILRFFKF